MEKVGFGQVGMIESGITDKRIILSKGTVAVADRLKRLGS